MASSKDLFLATQIGEGGHPTQGGHFILKIKPEVTLSPSRLDLALSSAIVEWQIYSKDGLAV